MRGDQRAKGENFVLGYDEWKVESQDDTGTNINFCATPSHARFPVPPIKTLGPLNYGNIPEQENFTIPIRRLRSQWAGNDDRIPFRQPNFPLRKRTSLRYSIFTIGMMTIYDEVV